MNTEEQERRKARVLAADPTPADGPDQVTAEAAGEPVYDARGNVRPHGTRGARPMTYAERVEIAGRLADGEVIITEEETPLEPVADPDSPETTPTTSTSGGRS